MQLSLINSVLEYYPDTDSADLRLTVRARDQQGNERMGNYLCTFLDIGTKSPAYDEPEQRITLYVPEKKSGIGIGASSSYPWNRVSRNPWRTDELKIALFHPVPEMEVTNWQLNLEFADVINQGYTSFRSGEFTVRLPQDVQEPEQFRRVPVFNPNNRQILTFKIQRIQQAKRYFARGYWSSTESWQDYSQRLDIGCDCVEPKLAVERTGPRLKDIVEKLRNESI